MAGLFVVRGRPVILSGDGGGPSRPWQQHLAHTDPQGNQAQVSSASTPLYLLTLLV